MKTKQYKELKKEYDKEIEDNDTYNDYLVMKMIREKTIIILLILISFLFGCLTGILMMV